MTGRVRLLLAVTVAVVVVAAGIVAVLLPRHGGGGAPPSAVATGCSATGLPTGSSSVEDAPVGPGGETAVATGGGPGGATGPAANAPSTASDVSGLQPVSVWEQRFNRAWRNESATAQRLSHSRDSWDHYTLSYSIDALTSMYLATGTTAYAQMALQLTENVASTAVPSRDLPGSQYHDDYLGWASSQEHGQEVPLYESYFWRYGTELLKAVEQPGVWPVDPALQSQASSLQTFVEHNVVDKWNQRGADTTIYRSRTHMASHWAFIALNLTPITQDPTRKALYQQIDRAVDNALPNYPSSLHEQMVADPKAGGALFWSDVWGSCEAPGQDVAHGSGVIAYVVAAHDAGVDWSDSDIKGFLRTFEDRVWPRPGPGSEFVDGSGTGNGWFSDGWVKLGRYDATLQRRLETHQPANAQFLANGALNAAILLRAGSAGP